MAFFMYRNRFQLFLRVATRVMARKIVRPFGHLFNVVFVTFTALVSFQYPSTILQLLTVKFSDVSTQIESAKSADYIQKPWQRAFENCYYSWVRSCHSIRRNAVYYGSLCARVLYSLTQFPRS